MTDTSTIVRRHVDAALAEAAETGIPADTVARSLLAFAIDIYRRERDIADVRSELEYALDNLDPDQDYIFMRP